ncbi:MAG: UDP-N-acetylmuramoyl-L-alanine--D-glutamate ligase [Bacteroidales bacterium]|jgi:UDP-N-acetylmuramoylalanine--D-glutamate ligase|nr:UDP-N-acetylmuramoyl-L-alanine--D-glutamate ligase [Bacteroidales bacterium]
MNSIFSDKKCVGLLGMGREGRSSYALIRGLFPEKEIFLIDEKKDFIEQMPELKKDEYAKVLVVKNICDFISHDKEASSIDFFLKAPGISLKNYPSLLHDKRMSSQTEIFLQRYGKQCIGITGTKGKSTTTNLIYHLLKPFRTVIMAGNMGIPLFDIVKEITPDTIVVCELSSHQLELVSHPPQTGILLNLYEEHLDHYVDYLAYQRAKMNIFNNGDGVAIFYGGDTLIAQRFSEIKFRGKKLIYGDELHLDTQRVDKSLIDTPCALIGHHNNLNKQAAILAVKEKGLTDVQIKQGLSTFKTLPHRLEYIGEIEGIYFYNDSISTIPQATIAAIESLRMLPFINDVGSVILGGFDRGIDYSVLIEYLRRKPVKNIVFTGPAGKRIKETLCCAGVISVCDCADSTACADCRAFESNNFADTAYANYSNYSNRPDDYYIFESDNFADIVKWCKRHTGRGNACLLSPAAASYDQFRNFEERGSVFTDLVRQ